MALTWRTYCLDCREELYADLNGAFAEAAARLHIKGGIGKNSKPHPGHKVMVGYLAEGGDSDE